MTSTLAPPTTKRRRLDPVGEIAAYTRSPVDVVRLIALALLTAVILVIVVSAEDTVIGLEIDLVEVFGFWPLALERFLTGALQSVVVVTALALTVGPLLTRNFRMLAYVLGATIATGLLMIGVEALLSRDVLPIIVERIAERGGLRNSGAGHTVPLAQLSAMFVVSAPFVPKGWRRTFGGLMVAIVLVRLTVIAHPPANLLVAIPFGAVVATAILAIFGRPDHRPTVSTVRSSLAGAGLDLDLLAPASVDARGSTPYFGTLADGTELFAKVVGEDNRAADVLFRGYRYVRLQNVGDEVPFSTVRRAMEHEAFMSLMAANVGVRTPRIRAVVDVGPDAMAMATELIDGRSLDDFEPEEVTDDLMRAVWEQVAVLRASGIAHRDLRLANVFVESGGAPWLIDFGFAEIVRDEAILHSDVAQLLASFSVVVEPERVVAAAIDALGVEAVQAAVPRLQTTALSGATQTALKEQKGRFEELRTQAIEQSGLEDFEYEKIDRIDGKTALMLIVLVAAVYFLAPQLADLPEIIDQIKGADWGRLPVMLFLSAVTYVGATISLRGSVPDKLPVGPTFVTQLGSSFASKVAPAGLGGMALNIRYMQKRGVDPAVAVSGVGLNSISGFVIHVIMTIIFLVWAGEAGVGEFPLPDAGAILTAAIAIGALLAIAMAVPAVRKAVKERLVPVIMRSLTGARQVVTNPAKVIQLLVGSGIVTFSYLLGLYTATLAFGGELDFATVGFMYLAGSAVATAVPTPGGLGAVEAALVAGLVAAGMDNSIAIPAVFLYRFTTFWLPILPGWGCFAWLRRADYI